MLKQNNEITSGITEHYIFSLLPHTYTLKQKKVAVSTLIYYNSYRRLLGTKVRDHIMLATIQTQNKTVQRANKLNIRDNRWRDTKRRIQGNGITISNG